MKLNYTKRGRAVFNLTVHMVFVTKYRRKVINQDLIMIANLKATSSKAMWQQFNERLSKYYYKKVFWTGAYFVASCGGVTIEQLKKYVENQKPCP